MMPGKFLFAYGIWQLWLSRNNRIFNPSFETLNQLMYKTLHLAAEFYHFSYHRKTKGTKVTKIIYWHPPQPSFVTLNTDGSSKYNIGKAEGGGVLRDSKGRWIKGFSIHIGIALNNIAEIWAVRYGLKMAWE